MKKNLKRWATTKHLRQEIFMQWVNFKVFDREIFRGALIQETHITSFHSTIPFYISQFLCFPLCSRVFLETLENLYREKSNLQAILHLSHDFCRHLCFFKIFEADKILTKCNFNADHHGTCRARSMFFKNQKELRTTCIEPIWAEKFPKFS